MKVLYIALVISVIAVLGVAGAIYFRVRQHLGTPEEHLPERDRLPDDH